MEPFVAGPQIHQKSATGMWGGGRMVATVRGRGKLCSQTSGNASISSDMMRTVMDGSYALFGN